MVSARERLVRPLFKPPSLEHGSDEKGNVWRRTKDFIVREIAAAHGYCVYPPTRGSRRGRAGARDADQLAFFQSVSRRSNSFFTTA